MTGPIIYPPHLITFEEYMAEERVKRRYDIVHGVRVFAVPPSFCHHRIMQNVLHHLSDYGDRSGFLTLYSLFDVLISWTPFCLRQPDVMLVSRGRWRRHEESAEDGWPLTVPPELVVEVLSSIDRELVLESKIADYCKIGVDECWVVRSQNKTVEVLRLTQQGPQSVRAYGVGETVTSAFLTGLQMAVSDVLAE